MDKTNILLITTDEHRGDALGGLPGSVVDTPYLEELRRSGVNFPRAYSACPVCMPARRTLMSGKTPYHHGVLMNYYLPFEGATLPEVLKNAGYQTHLCGKLHFYPERKLYGFCSADWADGPYNKDRDNDYERFLKRNGLFREAALAHGLSYNGVAARPFHMEDRFHFTNWCTDMALDFLERRDPSMPFFLNVSYHQPHAPCAPPAYYFEKYMNRTLPELPKGDWTDDLPNTQKGTPVNAWRVDTKNPALKEYRAGYYGCIEHIDHQIGRLLYALPDNTIIIFTSDHGEMLGDHGWVRKRSAYEGSARIPLSFTFRGKCGREHGIAAGIDAPDAVELMDVMPTILDLVGIDIPEGVDGKSLIPAMRGEPLGRRYIHGECARMETIGSGMQYLTDGKQKYIWYPALGLEQLFDLENDPKELRNLVADPTYAENLAAWRARMVLELDGREEGFVKDGRLAKLDGPTPVCADKTMIGLGKSDEFNTVSLY